MIERSGQVQQRSDEMSNETFQNLCAVYSDMYKDTYGCRPRGVFEGKTIEDVQAMIDKLEPALDAELERERKMNLAAIAEMEKRISDTVSVGAIGRRQAMAWLVGAHALTRYGSRYDMEEFFYYNGLLSAEAHSLREEFISVVERK
jgi:hypothetical protein